MATVADVARHAKVSPGVVSRLLNGDATLHVRPETRSRVLASAAELDYAPNYAARALRKARSGLIAAGVHDASNPIYTAIIEGAQAATTKAGYALMLADIDALATDDSAFKRIVAGGAIDGILLQRAGTSADTLISKIAERSVPTVLLNDRARGTMSSVAVDDYGAARLATEHLVALGHRRVALIHVDGPDSRADHRSRGWEDALRAGGLRPNPRLIVNGGHTPEIGARAMLSLLSAAVRPTAVFVANVMSAVGALAGARSTGVRVPEDVSVVGLHDFDLAGHLNPALTTVRLPLREMGERAVEILLRQLDGKSAQQVEITTPVPQLVVRASTRPYTER